MGATTPGRYLTDRRLELSATPSAPKTPLERIADVLEAVYDPERKALRLYDVERAKVYKAALAPEYRDKFGMDASKPEVPS